MRQAKVDDHWRHYLHNPPTSARLNKIVFSEVDGIGNGTVSFTGSIAGICGTNGVGKSTLLSVIYLALSKGMQVGAIPSKLISKYSIDEIDLCIGTESVTDSDLLSEYLDKNNVKVYWLDCAAQSSSIRELVNRDQNFEDFLDQTSPQKLDTSALKDLSFLVGKQYEKCFVFEIDEFQGYEPFPYFEVQSEGETYRSESMGKGELSSFLAYWYITRAEKNSFLLIEEPEAHLPVRTQNALMSILIREILKKELFVVLSTHSASIMARLPNTDLRLMSRINNEVRISKEISQALLNEMFGIRPTIRAVLLVEDSASAHFLRTILDVLCPQLGDCIEIGIAGSDGEVLKALDSFPVSGLQFLKIAGVLDGDMSNTHASKESRWPILFLPGKVSPEELLIQTSKKTIPYLARTLNVEEDALHAALGQVEGEDHHDWLSKLAPIIERSYQDCCCALTKSWLILDSNRWQGLRVIRTIQKTLELE